MKTRFESHPTGVLEAAIYLLMGAIVGALLFYMFSAELHKRQLSVIESDVKQIYDSFNECYIINEELLETFTKRN